jgi:hypothetical protein
MAELTTTNEGGAQQQQRLLELHGRLWGLATELLLPPAEASSSLPEEEEGGGNRSHRPSVPRPPRAVIEASWWGMGAAGRPGW